MNLNIPLVTNPISERYQCSPMNIGITTPNESPIFESLITLGSKHVEGLSVSEHLAAKNNIAKQLLIADSFAEAAEEVSEGRVEALFIPAAYPRFGGLIYQHNLKPVAAATYEVPAMHLVGCLKDRPEYTERVFAFGPTTDLIPLGQFKKDPQLGHCNSTADAAYQLLNAGESRFTQAAITTTNSLESFVERGVDLFSWGILKASTTGVFTCFVK